MTDHKYINEIVHGSEVYFRFFAMAGGICRREGDIEWIMPGPGFKGPSLAYKVSFPDPVEREIDKLLPGLQNGGIPSLWVLTPLSAPQNLPELLIAKGFKEITTPEEPEYGMAMDFPLLQDSLASNSCVEVKKVTELSDFKIWMDVVNTALHGWDLLAIEHYAVWLKHDALSFYLGYIDGKPVSTAATISNGKSASLEFVSTTKEYRNRGAASAVCSKALRDVQLKGAGIVTLRCGFDVHRMYVKWGFKPYYEQRLFAFSKAGQGVSQEARRDEDVRKD
jgi:GNAT superfamily N-acetyltransferase